MKKYIIVLFVTWIYAVNMPCFSENLFYYAGSEMYSLTPIAEKRAILKSPKTERENYVERVGNRIQIVAMTEFDNTNANQKLIYKNSNGEVLCPMFLINNSQEVVMLPEIVLLPKISTYDMSALCSYYHLEKVKVTKNYHLYSLPQDSDVIDIANKLYETGDFKFACPNFFSSAIECAYIPNDTYFHNQITCHNLGQVMDNGHSGTIDADIDAPEAWDITKGSPDIIIAVFDRGVTSNHPDLPNTRQVRLDGSNFGSGDPNDPSPTGNNNHGNACAGVIAATMDNQQGIAGIAPMCKIMPLRWDTTTSPDDFADGIQFAVDHGAKIISCSWGYKDSGNTPDSYSCITTAINNAIDSGVVVVFSAGNTADHTLYMDGYVKFPANANVPNLITVGSSDRYDHIANYSPKSSLIDFVAPSHRAYSSQISGETFEMWTLDIPGSTGYNPIPTDFSDNFYSAGTMIPSSGTNYLAYTGCFGGTSHSCPVVAGVVALMLSVNPYLTPAEVFDVLRETCDKVGGYTYVNGKCAEMGYGRVNAYAAVLEAQNRYPIQGSDEICDGDTAKYYLINPLQSGETVVWNTYSGMNLHPVFSIVGSSTQDTVYVRCQYIDSRLLDPIDPSKYLSATITSNNGTTSKTYKKYLSQAHSEVPTISASNTSTLWMAQTQRTFTITNCTDVPDNSLKWTVKRKRTVPGLSPLPPTVYTSYYYGRTLNYTPPSPVSALYPDTLTIFATNLDGVCGAAKSTSLQFIVIPRNLHLTGHDDGEQLSVTISEENEERQYYPAQLDEDGEYTLELWHSLYGSMRTQRALSANEQMNISGFPQGVYVLLLKTNGTVVAETKVQIQ